MDSSLRKNVDSQSWGSCRPGDTIGPWMFLCGVSRIRNRGGVESGGAVSTGPTVGRSVVGQSRVQRIARSRDIKRFGLKLYRSSRSQGLRQKFWRATKEESRVCHVCQGAMRREKWFQDKLEVKELEWAGCRKMRRK